MFNYIQVAFRNRRKNGFYTVINIVGLAIGLTFALLIGSYIWSEIEVNHYLKDYKNQYIIQSHWKKADMGTELTTLGPLAKSLKEQYPWLVKNYYRFDAIGSVIKNGDQSFKENIALGDSTLLGMYGFSLLKGNSSTALKKPFSVVLTEEKANKFFGSTNVIGKTITISSISGLEHQFMITGLLKKPFRNTVTHLNEINDNQFFVSSSNLDFFARNMNWNNVDIIGFIELNEGVSLADLERPIQKLLHDNTQAQVYSNLQPYLIPLSSYYLEANGRMVFKAVLSLTLISIFILLMAIINFINLSVSQSSSRLREISVRKVIGSTKKELIVQFLSESIALVSFSSIIAIIVFILVKDWFSKALYQQLPSIQEFPLWYIIFPFLLIPFIGLIAGAYPALILSSVNVISALKGKLPVKRDKSEMQMTLLGFQFLTATLVIIGAMVITKQIHYFFNTPLGYEKEFVITAGVPREYSAKGLNHMMNIRNQFLKIPEIENSSLSYSILDGHGAGITSCYKRGSDSSKAVSAETIFSDENFASTYRIPVVAGSYFRKPFTMHDSSNVVLNQTAVKMLGYTDKSALGKQLREWGDPRIYTVSGVVADFHFGSMGSSVKPLIFHTVSLFFLYRFICFKLKPGITQQTIKILQKKWSVLLPGAPFEYVFQNETLESLYRNELQLQNAIYVAGALALIIVLLGIFGLVSISIQRRTKELAIRKILGSSVLSIILLFTKDVLPVASIGALLACPIAYLMMDAWLNNYAYKIQLTIFPFLISICSIIMVSGFLIVVLTLKIAMANPVKSIKTE